MLLDQIKYYEYGGEGIIPPEWEKSYAHFLDDEWEEYQRLKQKFGGR